LEPAAENSRRLRHDEKRIDANADLGCKGVGDPLVNVLKKPFKAALMTRSSSPSAGSSSRRVR
jgi:hypothetical protein